VGSKPLDGSMMGSRLIDLYLGLVCVYPWVYVSISPSIFFFVSTIAYMSGWTNQIYLLGLVSCRVISNGFEFPTGVNSIVVYFLVALYCKICLDSSNHECVAIYRLLVLGEDSEMFYFDETCRLPFFVCFVYLSTPFTVVLSSTISMGSGGCGSLVRSNLVALVCYLFGISFFLGLDQLVFDRCVVVGVVQLMLSSCWYSSLFFFSFLSRCFCPNMIFFLFFGTLHI